VVRGRKGSVWIVFRKVQEGLWEVRTTHWEDETTDKELLLQLSIQERVDAGGKLAHRDHEAAGEDSVRE